MIKFAWVLVGILLGNCLLSCTRPKSEDKNIIRRSPFLTIDGESNDDSSNKVHSFRLIFDSVDIIPLKERDSSLLVSIDKLIELEGIYYILDKKYSKLYSFDSNGVLLNTYGSIGHGPGEFLGIEDFAVDQTNERIAILSNDNKAIYYYSLGNAQFLEKINIKVYGNSLCILPKTKEAIVYINHNGNNLSRNRNILLLNGSGDILDRYFAYNPLLSNSIVSLSGFLRKSNGKIFFSKPFDETIYLYDSGKFKSYVNININSSNVERHQEDFDKLININTLKENSTRFLLNTFLMNEDYIVFSYHSKARRKSVIYNIHTQGFHILEKKGVEDPLIRLIDTSPLLLTYDNLLVLSIKWENIKNLKQRDSSLFEQLPQKIKVIFNSRNENVSNYLLIAKLRNR